MIKDASLTWLKHKQKQILGYDDRCNVITQHEKDRIPFLAFFTRENTDISPSNMELHAQKPNLSLNYSCEWWH